MLQPVVGEDHVALGMRGEQRASRGDAVARHGHRVAGLREQHRLVAGQRGIRVRSDQQRGAGGGSGGAARSRG